MAEHDCETCGKPADLALTEIVSPRRAVVTRHFCKAHWPRDSDVSFKEAVDSTMGEINETVSDLQRRIERELEGETGEETK